MYCPKCNCINHYDNVFCIRCGAALTPKKEKTETQTTKEQSTDNSTSHNQNGNASYSQSGNAGYSQTNFSQSYASNAANPNMASPSMPPPNYYRQNIAPISAKSRGVAAVLCFWFGFLGIHRFYAGKILTGLLWMFTLGLFGFGSISDFIMIACGSFKDCYGYKIK